MATKITRSSGDKTTRKSVKPAAKKPVARKRVQSAPSTSSAARFFQENARMLFLVFSAVLVGVLLFVGYQKVAASGVFQLKRIDVSGTKRAPNAAIETIARRMSARSGVWNADLDAIRTEVEKLNWVKSAVVSRVLPDSLRVRVVERTPLAVVRIEPGKLVWVDDEAKVLGSVLASENPPLIMLGWNEAEGEAARKNNLERVKLYLKLLGEWQKNEITNRITAVDLTDLQDVVVFTEKDGAVIPIQIGNTDFTARFKQALEIVEQLAQNGGLSGVEKLVALGRSVNIVPKKGASDGTLQNANKKGTGRR